MFWELYQQCRIHQASQDASEARASARSAGRSIEDLQRSVHLLEQQVERLTLTAMAMAEVLRDRQGISEEELEAKVREIDLRDGRLDGKASPSVKRCGSCGRVSGPRRAACLYCGTDLPDESFLFGPERTA